MGKTTTYSPKYIKRVDKYLKECNDEEYIFQKMSGKTDGFEEKIKVKLPSIERFCQFIKIHRQTVYDWRDANPDFKTALDKIETEQKARLLEKGLDGRYNPMIAKFLLSASHGLREKSDLTSDDKPLNTFDDKTVDRIAERITARRGANGDTPSEA